MWDASKCNLCGDCLVKCLYIDYDKDKAVADIKALMEGNEADILSKCVTCCGCLEYCPTGADPWGLISDMMEKFSVLPMDEYGLRLYGLPPMERRPETPAVQLVQGDVDKPAVLIPGMKIVEDALESRLFEGVTVIKGSEYAGHIGYIHTGKHSYVEENIQKYIDNLAGLGKDIVFFHDEVYALFHVKIKDYGITTLPFKAMHLFEFLLGYLKDHQDSITKLGKKVAYQRPCSSRYIPETEPLLDEIFELMGLERPARTYEREGAVCCTGPILRSNAELAYEIQRKNVTDAIECGADALITICPVCNQILRRSTSHFGLRKIFITDLCRMALGEMPWPAKAEPLRPGETWALARPKD